MPISISTTRMKPSEKKCFAAQQRSVVNTTITMLGDWKNLRCTAQRARGQFCALVRRPWKTQADAQSTEVGLRERHRRFVLLRDAAHDGQPQAAALFVDAGATVEAVEHALVFLRR